MTKMKAKGVSKTYGSISRHCVDVHIIKHDIIRAHHERRPARRVLQVQSLDFDIRSVVRHEQDRPVEFILRVQDLGA